MVQIGGCCATGYAPRRSLPSRLVKGELAALASVRRQPDVVGQAGQVRPPGRGIGVVIVWAAKQCQVEPEVVQVPAQTVRRERRVIHRPAGELGLLGVFRATGAGHVPQVALGQR